MSLITRCPACLTTFRVVPDQLRISEGWVRCGQCQHVFDANAALVDNTFASPVPPVVGSVSDLPEPLGRSEPVEVPEMREPAQPAGREAPSDPAPDVTTDITAGVDVDLGIPSDGVMHPVAGGHPIAVSNAPLAQEPIELNRPDVSFMRRMPQASSWQRTSLRMLLGVMAVGLLAALGIQGAVQERDRIAAMFPQTKPALQWICRQLNCTVSSLRQIESVVIDSSSFNKIRPDAYRLGIVLRNTSALDIAMPALELTLTDSQDQPVMRRVLPAGEYSPASSLSAASDWSGSVAITVRGNGSDRFSGYKVLAFYP